MPPQDQANRRPSDSVGPPARRNRAIGCMVNGWLGAFLFSAGTGGLIFVSFVVPFAAESWSKNEFDLPQIVQTILRFRWSITAAILAIMALGFASLTLIKPRAVGLAIYLLCAVLCALVAVGGIFTFFRMYVELWNVQMR